MYIICLTVNSPSDPWDNTLSRYTPECYVWKQTIFLTHFADTSRCQNWFNRDFPPPIPISQQTCLFWGPGRVCFPAFSVADQFVDYFTAWDITVVSSRPIYGRTVQSLMINGRAEGVTEILCTEMDDCRCHILIVF